jgi:hypothetical protein
MEGCGIPPVSWLGWSSRKHFQERSAELQIPPLRFPPVGMTKGRVALPFKFDATDDEQQVPPLRFAPVGMTLLFGTSKRSVGTTMLPVR